MTHQEISKLRLQNQHLSAGNIQTAAELVYHFGAVQGQEYEQTKWGLGIRLAHLNNADIEKEIESGKIYRTHLLRPTWHLVHADDILWIQTLTAERVQAVNGFMYRKLELSSKILDRAAKIICQSLSQVESLTRAELSAILLRNRINTEGLRMVYLMMNAELRGLIANGKRQGKQHTYALLNAGGSKSGKIPHPANHKPNKTDREEGLLKLARRYFQSRGPATVKDFSTWSGLTIADCQLGINLNIQTFDKFSFEDEIYYHIPSDGSIQSHTSNASTGVDLPGTTNRSQNIKAHAGNNKVLAGNNKVLAGNSKALAGKSKALAENNKALTHNNKVLADNSNALTVNSKARNKDFFLLPVYDELIMGYKDRKSIMQNFKKGLHYNYDCMILYQGQVIGTYKRTIKSKSAFFEFDFFKPPDKKQKDLVSSALKQFESFSGLQVSVVQTENTSAIHT